MDANEPVEVLEYEVVNEEDPGTLARNVTRRLNEGWSLFGNPYCGDFRGRKLFCQAITRQILLTHEKYEAKYGQRGPAVSTEILKKAMVSRAIPPKLP